MIPVADDSPRWSTAALSAAAGASPIELSVLGKHLHACTRAHGRWFALQCGVEQVSGFVASRIVTTLALAALLMGILSMWS